MFEQSSVTRLVRAMEEQARETARVAVALEAIVKILNAEQPRSADEKDEEIAK